MTLPGRLALAYALPFATTGAVIALWLGLPVLRGDRIPFIAFAVGVVACGAFGGAAPALLATALSAVAAFYLGPPRYRWVLDDRVDQAFLATFLIVSSLIAAGSARLHNAIARSGAAHAELERRAREQASVLEAQVAARTDELKAALAERGRAEHALAQQFALTKAITDNTAVAIFAEDEHGRCVFMNPAAEAMTGYSLAEFKPWETPMP